MGGHGQEPRHNSCENITAGEWATWLHWQEPRHHHSSENIAAGDHLKSGPWAGMGNNLGITVVRTLLLVSGLRGCAGKNFGIKVVEYFCW
jgi:hypothetical protein